MAPTAQVWDTSCPDWQSRVMAGQSLVPSLPLFRDEADRALNIFKRLRLHDMPGKPKMGDVGGPWLFPIVEAIFGSFDPVAQRRMVQEYFLLIAKKNGKTPTGALIMVTALLMNRRPAAEFLFVAPTKEIAERAFQHAARTIYDDPVLSRKFHIQWNYRKIIYIDKTVEGVDSYLQVKAADTDVITGIVSTGVLIDETHVFAKRSNAAHVFSEIRGAMAARPDGFLIQITTQSKEPPSGQFAAELTKARDVRDGKIVDEAGNRILLPVLPILYELPLELSKDNGWRNRKYWPLVNPNLNRSVSEQFLIDQLVSADREGAGALALLASQHFNVEIGQGLATDGWAGAHYWKDSAQPGLTLDDIVACCDVIVAGVDGGGLDDLLSLAILGRVKGSREWMHWSKSWAHTLVFDRRKSISPKLIDFQNDHDLVVVDDMKDAFAQLADLVMQVEASGNLKSIGMDPAGVKLIVEALTGKGMDKDRIEGVSQGWPLQGTIKTTEVKLASGEFTHSGQPIMAWAVGNAKVEVKGNAITITKATAGSAKIDPLMALFDAAHLMSDVPENQNSGWQTDDIAGLMARIDAAAQALRGAPTFKSKSA